MAYGCDIIKNNPWHTILTLSLLYCIMCSGCITDKGNEETIPPTTTVAPTTVHTLPIYASFLQEKMAESEAAYEAASAEWQRTLEAFLALAGSPDSGQDDLYQAYTDYDAALREYERVLQEYCRRSILTEYTIIIEGDLLALKKETIPFSSPTGMTYTYGVLNMGAEEYMVHTSDMEFLIMSGIGGQESRQELLEAIERMEEFLPEYHDMIIGYVYGKLNKVLVCQSVYSDILEYGCDIGYI